IRQALERVVRGIYGPDDFVQRLDGTPGRHWNFMKPLSKLLVVASAVFGTLAQENNLRQVGAQIVVDVPGDTAAFAFNGGVRLQRAFPPPPARAADAPSTVPNAGLPEQCPRRAPPQRPP